MSAEQPERAVLELRFLGELEVARDGHAVPLPQSRKTRALLAYLAVTRRRHRRERLCSLLWDIADDPRGALRWSLTKLRPVVDEPDAARIVADRDGVAFEEVDARIDLLGLRRRFAGGVADTSTSELLGAAQAFRGKFLEGLELPDLHDFHAWCMAEREEARRLHAKVLGALVERLDTRPAEALPHARRLAEISPHDEPARANLIRLLAATGRREEAERQYEMSMRLLREMGGRESAEIARAWRDASEVVATGATPGAGAGERAEDAGAAPAAPELPRLVGRSDEWRLLREALDGAAHRRRLQVVLLTGEPGVGKSRLLAELAAAARVRGGTAFEGCSYEAEVSRPYGPWTDALGRMPAVSMGRTIGNDIAPLLSDAAVETSAEPSRDRLFGAVADLVAARAHSAAPVLLSFDDIQWCDAASAALLHYVIRMNRHRPVLVALAARAGELPDNEPMLGVIRGLRREGPIDELGLGPLSAAEIAELVRPLHADPAIAARIYAESAGNPLFAMEAARSPRHCDDDTLRSLANLVRDRVARLPVEAADLLRWAAALGHSFSVDLLKRSTGLGDDVIATVELLQRHALISPAAAQGGQGGHGGPIVSCRFMHGVVRRVVYADISEPRRRMMHLRIAQALDAGRQTDEAVASDIAHHAALAGEASLAARACGDAGRRALRLFANSSALKLANKGMRYAERLPEPQRTERSLELTWISLAARQSAAPEQAVRVIEGLAEKALDLGSLKHARFGFHMLGFIRWEGGDWSDALRQVMRAEAVSRSADDSVRVVALSEAARCLAMLERDLPQADAMLLEAGALARRVGSEPVALADAAGLLHFYRGAYDDAATAFERAATIARGQGDRVGEYLALEHRVVMEIQRRRYAEARSLGDKLLELAARFREGSEVPFATILRAVAGDALGEPTARATIEDALVLLRAADAKHRLVYALSRAATADLRHRQPEAALARATEALRLAQLLERDTDAAAARVLAARAAMALGDAEAVADQIDALQRVPLQRVSEHVRAAIARLMERPKTFVPPPGIKEPSPWNASSSNERSIRP